MIDFTNKSITTQNNVEIRTAPKKGCGSRIQIA